MGKGILKMRIGFTGSQRGMSAFQKNELRKLLKLKGATEFVFGDCIGSDYEAACIALLEGILQFSIYPQNKDTRKRAWFLNPEKDITRENGQWTNINGLLDNKEVIYSIRWYPGEPPLSRNMRIVDACDYVIATPKEFEHTLRSGTWATIRYAWKHKKDKITIIPPLERDE